MKANVKLMSALFNATFASVVLDKAVFTSAGEVTKDEAMRALCAGYIAGGATKSGAVPNEAQTAKFYDAALDLLAKSKSQRTADEQKMYMRTVAKYNYYFGSGASSGTNQKETKAKASSAKASSAKVDSVWAEIAAGVDSLSATKRKAFNAELAALRAKYGI